MRNQEERNRYMREWRKLPGNREKCHEQTRKWRYLHLFGITVKCYDKMLEEQKGCCASCGTDDPGMNQRYFCVDHDHKTGKVRSLLCKPCNVSLGALGEDEDRILKLALYARKVKVK